MGMEYLYIYSAVSEFVEDYYGEEYHEPWVSLTLETEEINYNKKGRDRLLITPLTFKVLSDGNLSVKNTNSASRDFEYSLNGGEWTAFSLPAASEELLVTALTAGDEISFRRDNDNFSSARFVGDSNLKIDIYGNLMSMQYGSGFSGQTEIRNLEKTEIFEHLFDGMGVVDASELLLPAMTLSKNCYRYMFSGCTDLLYAPELPAMTLANGCYNNMFRGCTSLVSAPELPATILANQCYDAMFQGCTSLTVAPELPSESLNRECYYRMFRECSNLSYIKCLATDISAANSTFDWTMQVSPTGVFIKNKNMETWSRNNHGIPKGWVVYDNELVVIDRPVFNYSGDAKSVRIHSDEDWSVISCPNWLSVSITSGGSGLHTIVMTAQTNNTGALRSGSFTVQTTDGLQTKTVVLVQLTEPENSYLTFFIKSDGNLYWKADDNVFTRVIEYNKNNEGWVSITSDANPQAIPVLNGDVVEFRGDNATYTNDDNKSNKISASTDCDIYGNIMSMIDSTGFTSLFTLDQNVTRTFRNFFDAVPVIDASKLILPATTLATHCYWNMFRNCKKLVQVPELPAMVLSDYCYLEMFNGCSSLSIPPELPAMTLANYCYALMFNNCTGLTTAPQLPARTMSEACYVGMFNGCTSLTVAPKLPATTLAKNCYGRDSSSGPTGGMFEGCTGLIAAPELPAMSLAPYCYQLMFRNCRLTSAPVLPATDLADGCYAGMFYECKNLVNAPILSANNLKNRCYFVMFKGCTSLIDAPELPATNLANGCYDTMFENCKNLTGAPELNETTLMPQCYSTMFKGCIALTDAPTLPSSIMAVDCYNSMFMNCTSLTGAPILSSLTLAQKCYKNMFNGCTSLTSAPSLPATTLAAECYNGMFGGCTSLVTSPELTATTLANNCYGNMFKDCTSLTIAPSLPANSLAQSCYANMFQGCSSLTTAPTLPATALSVGCYESMFSGCTSLVTPPELPATTLATACYNRIFDGCTNLLTAPQLPSTTLAARCYTNMFYGCASLTGAPALCATTLSENCYNSMFYNCTSLTTAPELPATALTTTCYKNMFNGCSSLNYVKALFTTDPESGEYTTDWLNGVSQTGTFIKNASATWTTTGPNGVPTGWTVITA